MKKNIITLFALSMFSMSLTAQVTTTAAKVEKVDSTFLKNWAHSDLEETGVYGVATHKALKFLASKNRKPQNIVVGVLDSGVEYFHEDLKNNMWVNPKEKNGNKKDDDKNGYIDDIHGWNFVTTKTGESYADDTLELTRELFRLEKKFSRSANSNDPEYQYYLKAKRDYYSTVSRLNYNKEQAQLKIKYYTPRLEALKNAFAGQVLNKSIVDNFTSSNTMANEGLIVFNELKEADYTGKKFDEVADSYLKRLNAQYENFNSQLNTHYNLTLNPKDGVDYKNYGSADVKGLADGHGTHVAGIIAAEWNNDKGMYGTGGGNHVKIMGVRVVPEGDERDIDVANGIRYAVDNGAKILNMSFGKAYSENSKLVQDAFKYAESKNVLIVKAAGNSNQDVDKHVHFPTTIIDNKQTNNAVLTVGASTRHADNLRARFSNYGKFGVDVFGPGTEYYATYPGTTTYRFLQGTSMASPAVAGVAALVWSHYPKLKASDIRNILMDTVNKNDQLKEISVSGGVVDAYKAVQKAEEIYKQRKLK